MENSRDNIFWSRSRPVNTCFREVDFWSGGVKFEAKKKLMKAAALIILVAAMGGGTRARGADQQADLQRSLPLETQAKLTQSLTAENDVLKKLFGLDVKVDGALPRAMSTSNPLQMINPFAPMSYGDGYDNVVVDFETKRANGIKIIGIRF
jgi:hypothetical protein